MDVAHELHRQQLIKAYNNAVKRKDWQAARNYRDELNILIAKKVALSWAQADLNPQPESLYRPRTKGFLEIRLIAQLIAATPPSRQSIQLLLNALH